MTAKPTKATPSKKKPASKAKATPARGRPTLYQAAYAEQARRLALLGQTDAEMAAFFGVAERTIHYWKDAHPDFLQSLKEGKADADAKVAAALYQRALGYSHPDTHISNYQGEITITPITKHYPPDPVSMIFWLKNRQPDKWRDRVEAEVSVSGVGELAGVYEDAMKRARERQQAILTERGLSLEADGE
jgi:hypothetical protein